MSKTISFSKSTNYPHPGLLNDVTGQKRVSKLGHALKIGEIIFYKTIEIEWI